MQNVNARAEAKAQQEMEAKLTQKQELKFALWQTPKDLTRGEKVKRKDLVRVMLPESDANLLGVGRDVELNIVQDTRVNDIIPAGSYIFPDMLTNPGQQGYIDLLATEGKILYPLPISTTNLINNYIRPGDVSI
ncbi:flp pilus assembly protein rcpC/cpaB [Vibrio ishigakensis]|uniref:Flp pilus assembly protein rcpC/cpaB n=1 Tax=Vibrio ishigakensis TaxID=1481914 RepID=A0A0B8P3Y5_9VIBR|nr:flp pilus assembly protein rcpC/cpaB [Vibrio ishigakensis]